MTGLDQAMVAAMAATPRPGGTPLLTRDELRQILEAAEPHIAAAQREADRQLAVSHEATAAKCAAGIAIRPTCQCATRTPRFPFAALLTDPERTRHAEGD